MMEGLKIKLNKQGIDDADQQQINQIQSLGLRFSEQQNFMRELSDLWIGKSGDRYLSCVNDILQEFYSGIEELKKLNGDTVNTQNQFGILDQQLSNVFAANEKKEG